MSLVGQYLKRFAQIDQIIDPRFPPISGQGGIATSSLLKVYVGSGAPPRQAAPHPDDVKAVSTPVSAARFRSNVVRVGMLKSNPRPNPAQNVIPVGD
ncbi:MAG: hypothetical protein WA108_13250, partial [Thiobacillus sp.]